jgi:DNA polymerase V
MFGHSIRAGFPSPADDYVADTLDLNEFLVQRKEATFFVKAKGDSMIGAGIHDGDTLIVDRSITASDGCIVIAVVDSEFTVKRLKKRKGSISLIPENPNFEPIEFKEGQELQVFGVVTYVIHPSKP